MTWGELVYDWYLKGSSVAKIAESTGIDEAKIQSWIDSQASKNDTTSN